MVYIRDLGSYKVIPKRNYYGAYGWLRVGVFIFQDEECKLWAGHPERALNPKPKPQVHFKRLYVRGLIVRIGSSVSLYLNFRKERPPKK